MAFSTWLKRFFGNQDNKKNDAKTYPKTIGELQESPLAEWGNQDIIKGLRFSATLQLRTPLRVLKHHHEFFNGSGQPSRYTEETWEGIWIPVTKSWKELIGKEIEEFEGTMASDVGYVPSDGGNYLKFLLIIRGIVERYDSITERRSELVSEVKNKKWNDFVQKLGGITAITDYFFPRFIDILPGLQKETVAFLWERNLTTPASIASSSDKELLGVKGIGPAKLKKIREVCADVSDQTSEFADLVTR